MTVVWSPRRVRRVREPVPNPRRAIDAVVMLVAERLGLSSQQRIVLRYLALGYRYHEIGEQLGIRTRTVKYHVDNVRKKVGARSRAELLGHVFATRGE